jgi:hypothetical protein
MAYSEGTQSQLAYTKETTWGVPSGSAFTVVRKLAGASVTLERTTLQTQEFNTSRAVTGIRLGVRKPRVSVPFELFYSGDASAGSKQFDDFMESWMCASATAVVTALSAQTVTVGTPGATTTFTTGVVGSGTIAVGDWIKVSGYATTQIANNGFYRVSAISTSVLTLVTPLYTKPLVAGAAAGTTVVLQKLGYVSPGTSVKSIAFEEVLTDTAVSPAITLSKMFIGGIVNTFSLTITPDAIITGTFDFMGKAFATGTTRASAATAVSVFAGATVAAASSWPAAATYNAMTANDVFTYVMADNALVAVATNITINGTNNIEDLLPVGATTPYALGKGDSVVTGTMDLYILNETYWAAYQAETMLGLSIRLMDPDTGTSALTTEDSALGYAIDIPNIKITNMGETKAKTNVVHNVTWSAIQLTSTTSTKGAATVNMRVSCLT